MSILKNTIDSVTAFAPATVANVAVGFDILGFPISGVGDTVTLTRRDDNVIAIENIESTESLPFEIEKNTASVALKKLIQSLNIQTGFSINIKKGIPLSSGMGGSAASAVAVLVAFNHFLEQPLSPEKLAEFALHGEAVSSQHVHGDNVIPCLFGGLTLIRSLNPLNVLSLPIPDLYCVLVHPHLKLETKKSRDILKPELPLTDYVKQSANLATFISALYEKDYDRMASCLMDQLIEPHRATLVNNFFNVKGAALKAGAIGCSLSGSGPSVFAFCENNYQAKTIQKAMTENFDVKTDSWITKIAPTGAYIM
jgi:homoserine kinase